jgi:hypothetical protein
MITFRNSKSFKIEELWKKDKTVSTLLVPSHLVDALKQKKIEHGNSLVGYFRNLISKYRTLTHSGMIADPRKIKTEYQDEGLELMRVSFRVANADWLEIGELALAFGKSRCWVFTFLLELDLTGFWEILLKSGLNDAVPTNISLLLRASWTLQRVESTFTREYYVRV